jgi:hypothetical protein
MTALSSPEIFWPLLLVVAATLVVAILWLRSRRKSPEEKERIRRLAVHERGRLADGELLDGPEAPPVGNLIYYTYRAFGVEYTAAQDVSALNGMIRPELCRPGSATSVKYDPKTPSNSIIVCEKWSGLHNTRHGALRHANN